MVQIFKILTSEDKDPFIIIFNTMSDDDMTSQKNKGVDSI